MAVEAYDILIPGHYFCDIIFTGIPGFPALGTELFTKEVTVVPGGVMNTVVGLTRLGVRVAWLSTLGDDFFSLFAAETARAEGHGAGPHQSRRGTHARRGRWPPVGDPRTGF